jgi:hypothetical protein
VNRSVRAVTCSARDISKVKQAFARQPLDHLHNYPRDYRGYLGEYPRRRPYTNRANDALSFEEEESGVSFEYLGLHQLRGREWQREYSQIDESPSLMMPSAALVQAGDLHWDHGGGWRDAHGDIQIQDPWWWTREPYAALICRMEYVDRFLKGSDRALILLGFQLKIIAGTMDGLGRVTEWTLIIRHRQRTRLIERKLVRD